jgi:nitric oxide reductase NorD protein
LEDRIRYAFAQRPAPASLLTKLFRRNEGPRLQRAVPATDGVFIWLPAESGEAEPETALDRFRIAAMQQAMRAHRGSPAAIATISARRQQDAYLLMEAHAADEAIAFQVPGMAPAINRLRRRALANRPPIGSFGLRQRPFELIVRKLLQADCGSPPPEFPVCVSPAASLEAASRLLGELEGLSGSRSATDERLLLRDWWTGDLRLPPETGRAVASGLSKEVAEEDDCFQKSARLARSPQVRKAAPEEDDDRPGAFMIQPEKPHEQAEDSMGMQRPTDRDEDTAPEEFAESLSDLPEARLVTTPGRPKEVLLSDDPLQAQARRENSLPDTAEGKLTYPEWDHRSDSYRNPGATVHLMQPALGPQQWVDRTLSSHRSLRETIRRRFEMLRAQPVRLRRQLDGDEIDLEAYVEGYADYRAGLHLAQAIYQTQRRARRSMAIMLLIDVSGSTDGWIGAGRRVIDVEREALLLVCLALESMGEPYAVLAFSGEGPNRVGVRSIKRFEEPYGNLVALRIAALEPEQFTRTGAAIRHATSMLTLQPASHRLLLLLSDGKPNDVDIYEGRYGIEDTRQAVAEASLQGVFPFCLTVDRQAHSYLPAIFGARQYGMLPRPELLPTVLLEWIKRLVSI